MTALSTNSVKKHVAAIHIGGKLTLLQRKIYNVLLANSYDNLLEASEHDIHVHDMATMAGFDSNDTELLKNAFRKLAVTPAEWNVLADDGFEEEEWTVTTLLSRATVRPGSGKCTYAYDPELCKKLFHPDIYARISLSIQRKFAKGHALALYENCVRFRGIKTTGWIPLEAWRKLFGIQETQYKEYKDFSKWVLKPAIEEVNDVSDIHITPEFRRENRRVSEIRFSIEKRPALSDAVNAQLDSLNVEPILERLTQSGITNSVASALILKYPEGRIVRNLDYVERELRQGTAIKNVGGYTVKAIEADYGLATVNANKASAQKKAEEEKRRIRQATEERARIDQQQQDQEKIERLFETLTADEKTSLINITLRDLDEDHILKREFKKRGLKSLLLRQAVLTTFRQRFNKR